MMNNVMLVGRVININNDGTIICISVKRLFKNKEGEYKDDIIPCKISSEMSDNILDYCVKGDLIGIKGRVEVDDNNIISIVSDKITFITPKYRENN